jgi:DNA-binding response OmpR family regulator
MLDGNDNKQPGALFWTVSAATNPDEFSAFESVHGRWESCPIILIGESIEVGETILLGLKSGASDFVYSPIHAEEIRIRFRLHHAKAMGMFGMSIIRFGDVVLDTVRNTLSGPGGTRSISVTETALLTILTHASQKQPVHKRELKQQCWRGHPVTDNALHRKLHAVRQLLREISNTVVIQTKYGVGFYLKSVHVSMKIAS